MDERHMLPIKTRYPTKTIGLYGLEKHQFPD
jgi:hypothetical protein